MFHCLDIYLPIHLLKDILVAYKLQVLAIMNKAAVNICVQVLCEHKFSTHVGKYQGM